MKIAVHNPNNLPTIDYRKVIPFQGNLKDLSEKQYEKLKKSLQKYGFFVPMFLWKRGDEMMVIDAHQRIRVLQKEQAQPYELPYLLIEAATETEAKEKLLVISSQYGRITQEGYDEFAFDLSDEFKDDYTHFDALPEFDYSDKNEEIDIDSLDSEMVIKLQYPEDEYKRVREQLSKIADTPEQAVWKLLGNE